MRLYHGSNVAVDKPSVSYNTGFSDLGRGYYLTDDYETARKRALSRARKTSSRQGVVSVYRFDEDVLNWLEVGLDDTASPVTTPFGLRFAPTLQGVGAWFGYIRACRRGRTEIDGRGDPAVVRAWIATELVEMACAGFAPIEELAELTDTAELIVQYCFRDQRIIDEHLVFEGAEYLDAES